EALKRLLVARRERLALEEPLLGVQADDLVVPGDLPGHAGLGDLDVQDAVLDLALEDERPVALLHPHEDADDLAVRRLVGAALHADLSHLAEAVDSQVKRLA